MHAALFSPCGCCDAFACRPRPRQSRRLTSVCFPGATTQWREGEVCGRSRARSPQQAFICVCFCACVCVCAHGRASNTSAHHRSVQQLCNVSHDHETSSDKVWCKVSHVTRTMGRGGRTSDLRARCGAAGQKLSEICSFFFFLMCAKKKTTTNFRVRLRWNRDACVI